MRRAEDVIRQKMVHYSITIEAQSSIVAQGGPMGLISEKMLERTKGFMKDLTEILEAVENDKS